MTLRCTHCSRRITSDASAGAWPSGPVGPVCAERLGCLPVKAGMALTVQAAKPGRGQVVRAAVNGAEWVDPAQMALELEAAC